MKRLFTVSFLQDQGVCQEEAPPHMYCGFSVLAWHWVPRFWTVFVISSIRWISAFLVLYSPFSPPTPLLSSPLSHLHVEGLRTCPLMASSHRNLGRGHCVPVIWSSPACWEITFLWSWTCYPASHWNFKKNCFIILPVIWSLYFP